jgi:hypothetical protein
VNASTPSGKPPFSTASTDEEGHYIIVGLPAGKYQLAPYQPADSLPERTMFDPGGKTVTLSESESVTGIDFALSAGSVITGHIVGSDGRPLIEQRITIENVENKQSFGGMIGGEMYRTDDRGIYRIYGLPAGRYFVSVGEANTGNSISIGSNTSSYIPRTYYPGVTERSDAKVVELSDGSVESGVDIAVGQPEKVYSISGRMIDQATGKPVPDVPAAFGPVQPNGSITAFGTGTNSDAFGEFKLNSLKPGKYAIFAGGFSFGGGADKWTSDPVVIEITDSDVTDVDLKIRAGASIDGLAVVEGTSDADVLRRLSTVRVSFFSANPPSPGSIQTPSSRSAQFGADGRFQLNGLSSGKYRVSVLQIGGESIFNLRSVEQDGSPTPDGVVNVEPGIDHLNVRLVLESGNGTIRGQVNLAGGELPTGWRLAGNIKRPGQSGTQSRSVSVDARGKFVIDHLAAGEYEIQILALPAPGQSGPPRSIPSVRQNATVSGSGETNVVMVLDLTPRTAGTPQ